MAASQAIVDAARAIQEADGLLICAGAGIGVDSGLPDFRGNEGFWKAYPALSAAGIPFASIANPAAFDEDPSRAWGFYGHRLALYRKTVPHAGFATMQEWGRRLEHGSFVFTSNVDGQFQRAGFEPERICECHGSIHHLQCTEPCTLDIWSADELELKLDEADCRATGPVPQCPTCNAMARPNILMFDDDRWLAQRSVRQEEHLETWLAAVRRPAVIEIGAGAAIATVRAFAQRASRNYRVPLIRINPQPEPLPAGAIAIATGALAGIEAVTRALHATS